MDVYIGLDVSLASTAVCVLSEKGKVLREATVDSEPDALVLFLQDLPQAISCVGLEAGPLSQWLYKEMTDAGVPTVLMETRQVKGFLKTMPIKTDKRDALGIARLLQAGWATAVHCKSIPAQETRALLTGRKAVQKVIIDLELSLRGVLRNFGLKTGPVSKKRYDERVRELATGNKMLMATAEPILRALTALRKELDLMEKQVRGMARNNSVCRLLMTMPGVGPIVALTFATAIDDPTRFRKSKDIGPWAGLTPSRDESGERVVVGSITKAGDAGLRAALYQAANVMLNHGGQNWLKAWALRTAERRGKKRATVALARRIGVVLHRMWVDGTEFRFTREEAMALQEAK